MRQLSSTDFKASWRQAPPGHKPKSTVLTFWAEEVEAPEGVVGAEREGVAGAERA